MVTSAIVAQVPGSTGVNHQFWVDYNPKWKLSERLELYGKIGAKSNQPNEWTEKFIL